MIVGWRLFFLQKGFLNNRSFLSRNQKKDAKKERWSLDARKTKEKQTSRIFLQIKIMYMKVKETLFLRSSFFY